MPLSMSHMTVKLGGSYVSYVKLPRVLVTSWVPLEMGQHHHFPGLDGHRYGGSWWRNFFREPKGLGTP